VPRNAEVIRQWTILREIERARGNGVTIDELASLCSVTTRTIRRDLQALEEAGFPLFDDRSRDDGRTRWSINGSAFKALTAGLTLSELSALYFSRTLLESLAGTPFSEDLETAFDKLAAGLTPHMRMFLDRLPHVIATKSDPLRRRPGARPGPSAAIIGRALEATLHSRQATLSYYSKSSGRTKTYDVHPYRLAYAQGGLYLLAFVPEYDEIRTFAIERVESLSLREEHFTPREDLPDAAFPHSLGVHSGPPERIVLEFRREVADYVRGREWHPSQTVSDLDDGGLRVTLDVCLDQALRSWILSFGASARVVSPAALAHETAEELNKGAAQYDRAG
jgi:predicted DNA-binding transcriptional regulator YafY